MSFLSIFDAVTPVITKILDFIPDPAQKLLAQQQLMASLQAWDLQQVSIDVEEAKSNSIFVAGARPFILWVCGVAVAYKFVIQPFLVFIIVACHIEFDIKLLPAIDWPELSSLMFGMLGLSGMRSYEKVQGVSK